MQYNLTERMAGMALTQVTEMYNQLRQTEAGSGVLGGLDILGPPRGRGPALVGTPPRPVVRHRAAGQGGVRGLAERLGPAHVGRGGLPVVDYIATFRHGAVDDDAFDSFIGSAKSWILAQQLAGDGLLVDASDAGEYDDTGDSFDDSSFDDFGDDRFDDSGGDDTWSE